MWLNEGLEVLETMVFLESSVESVFLPSTLKRVEKFAFHGCTSLKSIVLAEGLEFIGMGGFS